jgi:exodeoxyribonuclease VII large subunit
MRPRVSSARLARVEQLDPTALASRRRHKDRYGHICRLFQTLRETASPDAILAKGFALVIDAGGQAVRSPDAVSPGDPLTIRLAEGRIAAVVGEAQAAATASDSRLLTPRRAARRAPQHPKVAQRSLF